MQTKPGHETVLGRIAALAAQAAAEPDVSASLKTILAEIAELAGHPSGDTPEPSDVADTENQSL